MKRIVSVMLLICLVCSCCFVSVSASADSVKFATKKVMLTTGEKYTQKLLDSGKSVNTQAKWSSNNKSVATVKKGVVTAKAKGKVILKAVYKSKTYKFTVVVKNAKVEEKKLTLKIGQRFKQILKGANGKIKADKVAWSIKDSKIATINKNGVVKGVSKGTTTAFAKYKGKEISFKVVVLEYSQEECEKNFELLKAHINDYGKKNKKGNRYISNYDYNYEFDMVYNKKTEQIDFAFYDLSYEYEYVDKMISFSIGKNSYSSKLEAYSVYGYGSEVLGEALGTSTIYVNTFNNKTSLNFKFDEESTTRLANEKTCNKTVKTAFEYFDMLVFYETGFTLSDIGFVSYISKIE